jgi:hypothetical protein
MAIKQNIPKEECFESQCGGKDLVAWKTWTIKLNSHVFVSVTIFSVLRQQTEQDPRLFYLCKYMKFSFKGHSSGSFSVSLWQLVQCKRLLRSVCELTYSALLCEQKSKDKKLHLSCCELQLYMLSCCHNVLTACEKESREEDKKYCPLFVSRISTLVPQKTTPRSY